MMPARTVSMPMAVADKISSVFVPSVMGISALTFASWTLAGAPFSFAFSSAVTVLLITRAYKQVIIQFYIIDTDSDFPAIF
jgi:hypothetical protein